jgi:glucose-1-phosphate thymidylyltransferase
MKGIVLAGGRGSRLWPLTQITSKQLLPIYDKPLIHYPIATLMAAGIREILLICTEKDLLGFQNLLGDGRHLGISIRYKVQPQPNGIAEALILAKEFLGDRNCALILGDNILHGSGLGRQLASFTNLKGAHVFAYRVSDASEYGVIEFDSNLNVLSLEEKPTHPKSKFAVPGLYFYDSRASEIALSLKPSSRGELEITDVNKYYLEQGELSASILPRGTAWLDTGTVETMHDASTYIRILEERQGAKVSCIEEVAWRMGFISEQDFAKLAETYGASPYAMYLKALVEDRGVSN